MEIIFEIVIQIVFEVVAWAIGEVVAELGLNFLEEAIHTRTIGTVGRVITYAVMGVLSGVVSYFALSKHVFHNSATRIVGVVFGVILMGLLACFFSWLIFRRKSGSPFWSAEKFIHGVVFGVSYFLSRGLAID